MIELNRKSLRGPQTDGRRETERERTREKSERAFWTVKMIGMGQAVLLAILSFLVLGLPSSTSSAAYIEKANPYSAGSTTTGPWREGSHKQTKAVKEELNPFMKALKNKKTFEPGVPWADDEIVRPEEPRRPIQEATDTPCQDREEETLSKSADEVESRLDRLAQEDVFPVLENGQLKFRRYSQLHNSFNNHQDTVVDPSIFRQSESQAILDHLAWLRRLDAADDDGTIPSSLCPLRHAFLITHGAT